MKINTLKPIKESNRFKRMTTENTQQTQREYTTHIVIGLRWGDEGKGKLVDMLASRFSETEDITRRFCVRFNGGPNAGHTIYHSGVKVVTHQVPSGILYGMPSIIGDNCYVDIDKLKVEILMLREHGVTLLPIANPTDGTQKSATHTLYISPNAHVIQDTHLAEDAGDTRIGTTKSGIGMCARDKYARTGWRVRNCIRECQELEALGVQIRSPAKILMDYYETHKHHAPCLVEGAQAYGLDITYGMYPYVTSSHCLASDCLNMGINMHPADNRGNRYSMRVWGVAKAYETYVGAMQFQDQTDTNLSRLQELGHEFGSTTGRARQCNYLDLDGLVKAAFVNQCTDIVINKCDVLAAAGRFATRAIREHRFADAEVELGPVTEYPSVDEFKSVITDATTKLPSVKRVYFEFSASEPSAELTRMMKHF